MASAKKMMTFELLDRMDTILTTAKGIPFTKKVMVEKEEFTDLMRRLQESIPEEHASEEEIVIEILPPLQEMLLAEQPEDLFSLGRVYEKRGKAEGARMCYRAADQGSMSVLARGRMAESYRREGDYDAAARVYRRMIQDRQGGPGPLIALAKICEHKQRDIPAAMEYTRKAIIMASDQPNSDMAALQKRYQRLMMKARRKD